MASLFPNTRRPPGVTPPAGGATPGAMAPLPTTTTAPPASAPASTPVTGPGPSTFGDLVAGVNPSNTNTVMANQQTGPVNVTEPTPNTPVVLAPPASQPVITGHHVVLAQNAANGDRAALNQLLSELGVTFGDWETGGLVVPPNFVQLMQQYAAGNATQPWTTDSIMQALGAQHSPAWIATHGGYPNNGGGGGGGGTTTGQPVRRTAAEQEAYRQQEAQKMQDAWAIRHPGVPMPGSQPRPVPQTRGGTRNNPSNGVYVGR